ncbi:NAD(P)-dependent alcohol dehydrogenase [Niveibacterium sp. SC-1]|uniref:zinc-dependent alcohol dehydrogenase family protein n=1 Tax=Niveibacterium sp. SC-1 TaxID=3135646 RepID=UPI00311F7C7F
MTERMRSWSLKGLDRNLSLIEIPRPTVQPDTVLVRVEAVSLNYRDKAIVDSGMGLALPYPLVPGSDMAGTVVAVGRDVREFREGDRVISTFWGGWQDGSGEHFSGSDGPALGAMLPGVLSEYLALPETWLTHAPQTLDAAEASTLPCAALTAWTALVEHGPVRAGETVLIQGTGGVALFGLQFARLAGARAIVLTRGTDKARRASELGAWQVVDRAQTPQWGRAVRELTDGRGAAHVLEVAGGELGESLEALAQGGHIAVVGLLADYSLHAFIPSMIARRARIQAVGIGHRRAQQEMIRAIDANSIRPVIDARYAFAALPDALAHVDRGPFGKVVIEVGAS